MTTQAMLDPLIYTTRGNVPVASLKYEHEWIVTPDAYKFIERYRASDGEVVKESSHVYLPNGLDLGTEQESM